MKILVERFSTGKNDDEYRIKYMHDENASQSRYKFRENSIHFIVDSFESLPLKL